MRRLPVAEAVFDGEALWMSADGPAAFQDTVSQIDGDAPLEGVTTFLFDVLHVDGEDLLDTALERRAARLDEVARSSCGSRGRSPPIRTRPSASSPKRWPPGTRGSWSRTPARSTPQGVAARPGARSSRCGPTTSWCSAPSGGHGRRQGWLSNLHLGARDEATGAFVMVGKCFKGLTDELLTWQTDALLVRETARKGIAVIVRPELVVEIALDGVQASTRYAGGVALRFARVKRYRPDKSADEADTIDDLRALLPARI